jgi:hypothetical protein
MREETKKAGSNAESLAVHERGLSATYSLRLFVR